MKSHRLALFALLVSVCALPCFPQSPGWSRGQQLLPLQFDECVQKAARSLQGEAYAVDYAAGAFAVGRKGVHTAVIACNAAPDAKMWVNIFVASNGEGGGTERQRLQAQMAGNAAPPPPPPPTREGQPGRYLTVRVNGKQAILNWANAPVGDGAWVSIVPAGTPDGTHVGRWTYTEKKSSGQYENGPLAPGEYEARFYGDNGYGRILDRARFTVAADSSSGYGKILGVQLRGRSAIVSWSNAPTGEGAWVSVVPVGTADSTHVGKWSYTSSTASGAYESGPLNPGDYEARFYGDGGYGQLVERLQVRVY